MRAGLRDQAAARKGDNPDALLPEIRKICSNIESEVKVIAPEEEKEESSSHPLAEMLIGAALFVAGLLIPAMAVKLVLLIAAYLLLGRHVLLTAVKNIGRGQVFDENFLMAVATIGAWAVARSTRLSALCCSTVSANTLRIVRLTVRASRSWTRSTCVRDGKSGQGNGEIEVIPAEDAQEGDIVLVRPGDRVPLDGEVVEGESVWIPRLLPVSRFRFVSLPATRQPPAVSTPTARSSCASPTFSLRAWYSAFLTAWRTQRPQAEDRPLYHPFLPRLHPCCCCDCPADRHYSRALLPASAQVVYTAMTFLVISCPCALVLSVPLTYFSGIGAGSRRGILFKGGASLEALNNVKTIVMDKTGTITKGNFVVQKVVPAQGVPLDENELLWLAAACEGASTHNRQVHHQLLTRNAKRPRTKAGDVFLLFAVGANG